MLISQTQNLRASLRLLFLCLFELFVKVERNSGANSFLAARGQTNFAGGIGNTNLISSAEWQTSSVNMAFFVFFVSNLGFRCIFHVRVSLLLLLLRRLPLLFLSSRRLNFWGASFAFPLVRYKVFVWQRSLQSRTASRFPICSTLFSRRREGVTASIKRKKGRAEGRFHSG